MRKNTQQVLAAFLDGKPCRPCNAIWTDGRTVFSYATAILTGDGFAPRSQWVLNRTKYSTATTIHQNGIAAMLPGYYTVEVTGLERGVSADTLLAEANEMARLSLEARHAGERKYRVIRFYFNRPRRTIMSCLTLAEAQAHCSNPETSSSTAKSATAKRRTARLGPWFDGYDLMPGLR